MRVFSFKVSPPMATRVFSLLAALVITAVSCASVEDAIRNGDAPQSAGRSEESVEQSPADADALLKRAIAHAKAKRYDDAIDDLDAAIALTPYDAHTYLYRGVTKGITRDYGGAAADHQSVLNLPLLSPEDAATEHGQLLGSFTMWTIYLRSGDFDKAIADYDTFTRLSPNEADAYMWRGCAYHLKGEHEKALADFDKALSINPTDSFTLFKRGLSHARLGNSAQAEQDFTRALDIGFEVLGAESASDAQAHLNTLQTPSDHEQGIFHYDRSFERLKQADYDGAVADIGKARKLIDPQLIHLYTDGMHEVYFQSGIAYYDTGLYDQAALLFDKAIDVVPSPSDYPAAYYQRGLSHYREGRHRQAIADFDMVVHLEQDYPDAAHYRQLSQEELLK